MKRSSSSTNIVGVSSLVVMVALVLHHRHHPPPSAFKSQHHQRFPSSPFVRQNHTEYSYRSSKSPDKGSTYSSLELPERSGNITSFFVSTFGRRIGGGDLVTATHHHQTTHFSNLNSQPRHDDDPSFSTTHPLNDNLYIIPEHLYPTFRTLPFRWQVFLTGIIVSVAIIWQRRLRLRQQQPFQPGSSNNNNNNTSSNYGQFFCCTLLLGMVLNMLLQELLLPPTRISAKELQNKHVLPSKLSRYEHVTIPGNDGDDDNFDNNDSSLGVHFLEYNNSHNTAFNQIYNYDAIYVNHGFGANALSWLPSLPTLVDALGARKGLGHDAVGLGFTDRPNNGAAYSFLFSAKIGNALLLLQQQQQQQQHYELMASNNTKATITATGGGGFVLMGHSMGSITTLQMALDLPREIPKRVILVSPALGYFPSSRVPSWFDATVVTPVVSMIVGSILNRPLQFTLRRVIGTQLTCFWKCLLQLLWGPTGLTDADVLRFKWHAIAAGWERGMIHLALSFLQPTGVTDDDLISQVLELPNTTIDVIVAAHDVVVPPRYVRSYLAPFQDKIGIVQLNNLGHDPHEEDVNLFVDTVSSLLAQR